MTLSDYDIVIALLKEGGFPAVTGMTFTPEQISEIRCILYQRREKIDEYLRLIITRQGLTDRMMVKEQEIIFRFLDSGDKSIDSIYFIKNLFLINAVPPSSQIKILEYLKREAQEAMFPDSKNTEE